MKTLDLYAGENIYHALQKLAKAAPARMEFNGTEIIAQREHSFGDLCAEWERLTGRKVLTPDEQRREAAESLERMRTEQAESIASAKAQTADEMQAAPDPWPKSEKELASYIAALVDRPHDYNTCCYAMSLAAVAALNYVASALGCTGFQSSCADLDFLRRQRNLQGPFMLVDASKMLFPQYDVLGDVKEFLESDDVRKWLKAEAEKNLAVDDQHSPCVPHWKKLANSGPGREE